MAGFVGLDQVVEDIESVIDSVEALMKESGYRTQPNSRLYFLSERVREIKKIVAADIDARLSEKFRIQNAARVRSSKVG